MAHFCIKYVYCLYSSPGILTCAVTPLRVIKMKFSDPLTYAKILELGDNLEVLQEKPQWPHFMKTVIEPINSLGIEGLGFLEIQKIVGIILTNTFETASPGSSLMSSSTVGMYLMPSMMNHHCVANTRVVLDSANNMKVNNQKVQAQKSKYLLVGDCSLAYQERCRCLP